MKKFCQYITFLFLGMTSMVHANCIEPSTLSNLNQNELDYMLNRVPPAFGQAVEDQAVIYQHTLMDAPTCKVRVNVQMPEAHLKEAQQALDGDPSKKILLAAQGYSLPEQTEISATYTLEQHGLKPKAQETLQSSGLGQLRASIEMMYSLITQQRLNTLKEKANPAWASAALDQANSDCKKAKNTQQCECKVRFYAKHISIQDYQNLEYAMSNPYAFASVNNPYIASLKEQYASSCPAP